MTDVAVVGNGVAGYACAARLARHGLRPLLIGPGLPVDRPPLTKAALADGVPRLLADAARLAERGIEWLDGVVVSADLSRAAPTLVVNHHKRVAAADGGDGTEVSDGGDGAEGSGGGLVEVEAERIVLATGLAYPPPPVPGLERAHVNAVPAGLEALRRALTGARRRVLIVGAGLVGVESAATLARAGHDVTVVEALPRPLHRLHDPIPALAAGALERAGARFLGEVTLERAEGRAVVTAGHDTLQADVVLAATGGRPLPPPGLEQAELPLAVDDSLRVPGLERVHAVGDLAAPRHARFGRLRFPHWDGAVGTGEHAADAIAGVGSGPYDRLPYWWSDIGETTIAEVGLAEAAVEWREEGGLHVGRDGDGAVVSVLVVDEPRRLREARALVLGAA